jgi:very-short-patch-repair endonuclease
MNRKHIVTGRKDGEKQERARQLRREMTPAEGLLWERLRNRRLGGLHFRRQQVIDGFITDFYCHAAGLVVELDGSVHDQRKEADAERDNIITDRGLRILRFQNTDIEHAIETVLAAIEAAAQEFHSPPGP